MRLVRQNALTRPLGKHPDARTWIAQWIAVVEDADWHSIHDVRIDFPSADGVKLASKLVVTVFNVRGNEYRLLTYVDYPAQFVQVLELMTHAEYDKDQWKRRY
ncbi:MAG: type II toxin-antitoxin system HigB family toxin [Tepidisphaeraceae bacterium]